MVKKSLFYLFVAMVIFGGQFFINRGLVTGQPPPIEEKLLNGAEVTPNMVRRPAIIYFWAEWCGICNLMKDSLSSVLQEHAGVTIAVRSGDDDRVLAYLQQHGLDWPVVNDDTGEIAQRYGVKGVPALFYIGQDGSILMTSVGFSSEPGIRFRLWLSSL